uniref:SUEL-type lectin domain-containing protein n=1 Tax=Macrostomum lignano TaxID=282301 RepID=A0A1I8GT09_9PLAT
VSLAGLKFATQSEPSQVVKLRCEELQRCSLFSPTASADDPYDLGRCEQLLPHLSVRYTCQPAIRNRFLCADTYSTISCDNRQKLMVLDAVLTDKFNLFKYGRCPNTANPSQGASHCPETNVFDDVKRQCDSRPSCTIGALHSVRPGCARPNLLLLYAC